MSTQCGLEGRETVGRGVQSHRVKEPPFPKTQNNAKLPPSQHLRSSRRLHIRPGASGEPQAGDSRRLAALHLPQIDAPRTPRGVQAGLRPAKLMQADGSKPQAAAGLRLADSLARLRKRYLRKILAGVRLAASGMRQTAG